MNRFILTAGALLILCGFAILIRGHERTTDLPESDNPFINTLFPGGRPIGQPYSRHSPGLRVVRVDSYDEALEWFYSLRGEIKTVTSPTSGCRYHICPFDDGYAVFSRGSKQGTHEVAVLRIFSETLAEKGIEEVRFVETVKWR